MSAHSVSRFDHQSGERRENYWVGKGEREQHIVRPVAVVVV